MPRSFCKKNTRGLIFVLSAPAGTGKTTLVSMLTHEFPDVVASISYTTRRPRGVEQEGVHYYFISPEEFAHRQAEGEFLEHAEVYGCHYGTSKAWVEQRLAAGQHVFLVIDTQGAAQLKEKIEATYIFVSPPSLEELARRLRARKTEPRADVERRLEWAKHEMEAGRAYDYEIVNDNLDAAYQVLRSIVIAEEHRIR